MQNDAVVVERTWTRRGEATQQRVVCRDCEGHYLCMSQLKGKISRNMAVTMLRRQM